MRNKEDLGRVYDRVISLRSNWTKKNKQRVKKKLKNELLKLGESERHLAQLSPFEHAQASPTVSPNHIDFRSNPAFLKSGLTDDFRIKIADLGNGCWTHHHFQPEIQTRQYRAPETILGVKYNERTDVWSLACMLFEMLTGEFLFDPRKNENWSKSADHLMLMARMLNRFPRSFSTIGSQSKKFFDKKGDFKAAASLDFQSMEEVLVGKYNVQPSEARALQEFLLPMLRVLPEERVSALEALRSPWLQVKQGEELVAKDPPQTLLAKHVFEPLHRPVTDAEDFDADNSRISDAEEELDDDPQMTTDYDAEIKFFDRNFKNYYVGYADGIDLNHLDNTVNFQFHRSSA